jgi:hypothetical protein
MGDSIHVQLFGSLRHMLQTGADCFSLECLQPMGLDEILREMGIPGSLVQLAMANHRALGKTGLVGPGDRLALFPKEYAVFVDWKDFRT